MAKPHGVGSKFGGGSVGTSTSASSGSTGGGGFQFPIDPSIYANLINQATSAISAPRPGIESFIQQGVSSPMLQGILQPLMQSLLRGEEVSRRNLTDQARIGGNLNSGALQRERGRLEGEFQGRRGEAIGGAIQQFLAPILQALLGQRGQDIQGAGQFAQLLGALPNPVFESSLGFQQLELQKQLARQAAEKGATVPRDPRTGLPVMQGDLQQQAGPATSAATGSTTLNLDQILAALLGGRSGGSGNTSVAPAPSPGITGATFLAPSTPFVNFDQDFTEGL
jgi:hypothetical protein